MAKESIVSLLFCAVLVAVFFGCDASTLALRPQAFEASDLLTALLAHKSTEHLVLNLACLLPAGALFERRHGTWALVVFCVASGIVGNLFEVFAAPNYDGAILGASGIGLALFGAFAFTSRFTALVSMGLLCYMIHGAVVQPSGGIAYFVHLGGYAFGILWTAFCHEPAEERLNNPVRSK